MWLGERQESADEVRGWPRPARTVHPWDRLRSLSQGQINTAQRRRGTAQSSSSRRCCRPCGAVEELPQRVKRMVLITEIPQGSRGGAGDLHRSLPANPGARDRGGSRDADRLMISPDVRWHDRRDLTPDVGCGVLTSRGAARVRTRSRRRTCWEWDEVRAEAVDSVLGTWPAHRTATIVSWRSSPLGDEQGPRDRYHSPLIGGSDGLGHEHGVSSRGVLAPANV
jgi:hypothetical protein